MRVQGDSRSKGDKPMVVRCSCGTEVMTLRPGQVLNLRKPGRALSVTCTNPECKKTFTVNVADAEAAA